MTVRHRTWRGKDGRVRKTWTIDFVFTHPDGTRERIRKPSPVHTRRGAEAYERELRSSLLAGTHKKEITPEQPTRKRAPRFEAFAKEYLQNWAKTRNKPSTLQDKQSHLRKRLVPRLGRLRLDEINARTLDSLKAWMLDEQELEPNTINNHLTTLGDMLTAAVEWDYLEKRPRIRKLKANTAWDFLDFDETDRLLEAAAHDPDWHPMILVAVRTGLRRGELLALRWEDVDLVAGKLVVRWSATRGVVGVPKSGHGREVPLSRRAVRALKSHRHLRGPLVFCREDGRMLNQDRILEPLHRVCKAAGLRPVGWHVMRHTFASHMVMRGKPLKSVQEILGHASITTTMRYAHLSPSINRAAVDDLDTPPPVHRRGTCVAHDGALKDESRPRGG